MKTRTILVFSFCALSSAVAVAAPAAGPRKPLPRGAAGMTAHKDPKTGRLVTSPQGAAVPMTKEISDALSMSQEGLVEVPAPGGGYMIDLRGRFQSAAAATVAGGKVSVHCGETAKKKE